MPIVMGFVGFVMTIVSNAVVVTWAFARVHARLSVLETKMEYMESELDRLAGKVGV